MESTMNIRAYLPGDREALVSLWVECGLVVATNNPHVDIDRKLAWSPEWLLVGEIEGRLTASCMVGYEGHRGWINYLAVAPDLQGRGLGRAMLARAEEMLRGVGCAKINLQVRTTNRRVISFYERLGFRVDDVVGMGRRLEEDRPLSDS